MNAQPQSLGFAIVGSGGQSNPTLHELLRSATQEVHERLHSHPGLAAVKAGTITRERYVALLRRLYGFHRPFEIAAGVAPERTQWLESDLAVFSIDRAMCSALPNCRMFHSHPSQSFLLGASYVVEGSALGGRGLARALDGLLGMGVTVGRSFFTGHGAATGTVWRDYLARLSAAPNEASTRLAVISGATATFAIFEQWLAGWDVEDE